jgi:predicted RNA binding protein YcfA (HicA-like mRNA interferase family)
LPKLPVISGYETIRAPKRGRFVYDRQSGSRVTLRHHERRRSATVRAGNADLPPGPPRAILREAGLSVEEFIQLLK